MEEQVKEGEPPTYDGAASPAVIAVVEENRQQGDQEDVDEKPSAEVEKTATDETLQEGIPQKVEPLELSETDEKET